MSRRCLWGMLLGLACLRAFGGDGTGAVLLWTALVDGETRAAAPLGLTLSLDALDPASGYLRAHASLSVAGPPDVAAEQYAVEDRAGLQPAVATLTGVQQSGRLPLQVKAEPDDLRWYPYDRWQAQVRVAASRLGGAGTLPVHWQCTACNLPGWTVEHGVPVRDGEEDGMTLTLHRSLPQQCAAVLPAVLVLAAACIARTAGGFMLVFLMTLVLRFILPHAPVAGVWLDLAWCVSAGLMLWRWWRIQVRRDRASRT